MIEQQVILAALAIVLVVAGREWRLIRLRDSLNRSIHEIRRPLQALALDGPRPSVAQAIRAVGDLDHQLNGGAPPVSRPELVACRLMVDACVRRWRSRAHLAGAEIELRWVGPDALVRGDGIVLAGAIENLVVNAIEHGGPQIRISAMTIGRWVRIEVADSGRSSRPEERQDSPAQVMAQQRGRSRGHGLRVAERTVLDHGGRFEPEFDDDGSKVTIALPCSRPRQKAAGSLRVNW
ncbi:MAG: ATP-binding protein [Actinomycetota bacterium]|nr:ATP-binding protein [Actinomycetota bacterium]